MKHTYRIDGMTCGSCESKVKSALMQLEQIVNVEVSNKKEAAVITMDKHVALIDLQKSLANAGEQFKISPLDHNETEGEIKSWWQTYKPILLIAVYLLFITILVQFESGTFDWKIWMRHFMAGFFLTFSFFKMLNLQGFADSYKMYDIVARKFPVWGYGYAFFELGLGIAFLININPLISSIATFVIMSISIIGVLQTVLNKKKIQCACLGDVFKLPMSTVTIVENGLMIAMSIVMIITTL